MKDLTEEDLPKLLLVEDLGMMLPNENSIRTTRFGIYNNKYTRATFESECFGQMLEKLYPKEILDECIKRTQFGFEIIKDFDREVKKEGLI